MSRITEWPLIELELDVRQPHPPTKRNKRPEELLWKRELSFEPH